MVLNLGYQSDAPMRSMCQREKIAFFGGNQ
jgi:hypothetical protein